MGTEEGRRTLTESSVLGPEIPLHNFALNTAKGQSSIKEDFLFHSGSD